MNARPLTLVFLMRTLRAPTPPRSPPDMPSTSSMIRQLRLLTWMPAAAESCATHTPSDLPLALEMYWPTIMLPPENQPSNEELSMLVAF